MTVRLQIYEGFMTEGERKKASFLKNKSASCVGQPIHYGQVAATRNREKVFWFFFQK
jgi:hypothetical protein